jgi:hypothetical protein
MLEISTTMLASLMEKAAELGAMEALCRSGQLRPYLNQAEAFRLYGRRRVERWVAMGRLIPIKDGDRTAKWRIDRLAVAALDAGIYFSRYL